MGKARNQHRFYPVIEKFEANDGRFHALLDADFWAHIIYAQRVRLHRENCIGDSQ